MSGGAVSGAATVRARREGYLPVPGGMVWYRMVGSGSGTPLLVLHGGPGAASSYLANLGELGDDRPVILFDQLGGGRSEAPDAASLWRMDRFVAEVAAVRQMLGCARVHLYGHSWGGWLAIDYLLTSPPGVDSVTLASASASLPEQMREVRALRAALPAATAATMRRHEASGDLAHPEYRAAVLEFYRRHLCRLPEWPPELTDVVARMGASAVYRTLLGPNELVVTGSLRGWDRTADLPRIRVPALVTVGRYDEITPACAQTLCRGLPDARLAVFEHSAHMPHLEEPVAYLSALRQFLRAVDDAEAAP